MLPILIKYQATDPMACPCGSYVVRNDDREAYWELGSGLKFKSFVNLVFACLPLHSPGAGDRGGWLFPRGL